MTLTIEQRGTFVRATVVRLVHGGERVFEYEGRFTSGQLVLFFEDKMGADTLLAQSYCTSHLTFGRYPACPLTMLTRRGRSSQEAESSNASSHRRPSDA